MGEFVNYQTFGDFFNPSLGLSLSCLLYFVIFLYYNEENLEPICSFSGTVTELSTQQLKKKNWFLQLSGNVF